ncbi:piezo-type mechanosensitive ion channel component-like isoform X2 [Anthonomus grandis grandis]|uniref:piezo-type mechanosensitive ion channel component-like isoform X2 n=1 Tax=Anthonomus grandis grandis TaxID=2921223 RepID=UPI0021666F80|nr:piezo-type mechanosensitive ion channel component-like isoform X2 [Anthonomus grandis grandis]
MANYWWRAFLFRIVYPTVALYAALQRPSVISFVYLLLACYAPFYSVPFMKNVKGHMFMKISTLCSLLTSIFVLSCYMVIFFPTDKEFRLTNCSPLETLLRTVGIVNLDELELNYSIIWIFPEPLMLVTSVVMFFALRNVAVDQFMLEDEETDLKEKEESRVKILGILTSIGKYVVTFLYCITSILRPSILGAVYFLIFLIIIIYWALNNSLKKKFARVLCVMLPVLFTNMACLYWYQFQYFQDRKDVFDPNGTLRRLFNFVDLKVYKDCKNPYSFIVPKQPQEIYAEPICLYFLYYFSVLVIRQIFKAEDGISNLILEFFRRDPQYAKWRRGLDKIRKMKEEDRILREGGRTKAEKFGLFVEQVLQFLINISYLIGNFLMMIWAITFVGWKGFILLCWANLIWLIPFRKKMMLYSSPFLVLFVIFLSVTAYAYTINLTEKELPSYLGVMNLAEGTSRVINEGGRYKNLLLRSLYAILMLFILRQLFQEIAVAKLERELIQLAGSNTASLVSTNSYRERKHKLEKFQSIALKLLAYFWLYVVIILMIWMNFWTATSLFRIVFVGLAIIVVMVFQIFPYTFFKKFLRGYWWVVILYSTFNLLVLYAYQIKVIRNFMHIYVNQGLFKQYGFEVSTRKKELGLALANPLFFQLAVVIQQHYLQDTFNVLTSPRDPADVRFEEELFRQQEDTWFKKVRIALTAIKNTIFGVMELHMRKICLLIGWYMCIFELSALFVPVVLLFTISCIFTSKFRDFSIYFVSCFLQVLIIMRLLYMVLDTQHDKYNFVGYYTRNGKTYNKTLNTMDWIGFHKSGLGPRYSDFHQISLNFYFIAAVTLMRVCTIRMSNYRVSREIPDKVKLVLFPEVTYENYHTSVIDLIKFWVNYFFYKFGCEICAIACIIVIWERMDFIALCFSVMTLIIYALPRRKLKRIWIFLVVIAAFNVPIQYLATLGFWPTFWDRSMTQFWSETNLKLRIQQFCHISNMAHPPVKHKLTLDFWLYLLCSRQRHAFKMETLGRYEAAGENEDVSEYIDDINHKNPVPDYVTYTRCDLDFIKRIFFTSWFYVALLSTFLAGALMPTLLSVGYILGAFYFLWQGSDIYLFHPKTIQRRWNILLGYSIVVMMIRVTYQIIGCILVYEKEFYINCMVLKIFSIGCVDKYSTSKIIPNLSTKHECHATHNVLGLGYDLWCFFFLTFQQRIFKSYHFFHLVNDAKAQIILEDRGALLIEEIRQKKKHELDTRDAKIKENCKKKLEQLNDAYKKALGDVYEKRRQNHWHMQKSADYFLFNENMLKNNIALLPPKEETVDDVDPFDPMRITHAIEFLVAKGVSAFLAERSVRIKQTKALKAGKKPEVVKKMTIVTSTYFKSAARTVYYDPSTPRKILNVFILLFALSECSIVSIYGYLNRNTKPFRQILIQMDLDRRALKEKTDFNKGHRHELTKVWSPTESFSDIIKATRAQDVHDQHPDQPRMLYSIYLKLIRALWFMLITNTEWWCYCVIILIQTTKGDMMTLPIILFTFGWGVLTVPRPTKTFWIVSISYTLIMVGIKLIFLLDVINWDFNPRRSENLFFPPQFIGMTKTINLYISLINLAVLFLHRGILQMLGLWKPKVYRTISLITDGAYTVTKGKFTLIKNPEASKQPKILSVKTENISLGTYFPKSLVHGLSKYGEGVKLFIQYLVEPASAQIPVDVYTPMFLCDVINLLLLTFCYGSFMSSVDEDGLYQFVMTNRVPVSFIIVFLAYILLMIIDRAIYMRRNRFAKIIYYYLQVFFIHVWFFILFPFLTYRRVRETPVVQTFYVFKALYFLLSAYQIRNGYPLLISYHTLWHGYGVINRFGYKLYTCIYYFFEIRLILDWMWSESCLAITAWFKIEEITQNMFDQRCEQVYEEKYTSPTGEPKKHVRKYIVGTPLIIGLILSVIFPFILFSLGSQVGIATRPTKFGIDVYMGSTEPIFKTYATEERIVKFTTDEYKNLTNIFNNIPFAQDMFGGYEAEDVIAVKWSTQSLTTWKISPGAFKELRDQLLSKKPYVMLIEITFSHVGHGGKVKEGIFRQRSVIHPLPDKRRELLLKMLESNVTADSELWLDYTFPKFLLITKEGEAEALSIMAESYSDQQIDEENDLIIDLDDVDANKKLRDPRVMRHLLLKLSVSPTGEKWDLVHNRCDNLIVLYVFNERVFSDALNWLTQSGILGLYLIYFFLVIEVIRGFRIEVDEIWVEDLPDSVGLWDKCMEVCIARDMGYYELEELLYAELVFIMRSRETLIRMSRSKSEESSIVPAATKGTRRAGPK